MFSENVNGKIFWSIDEENYDYEDKFEAIEALLDREEETPTDLIGCKLYYGNAYKPEIGIDAETVLDLLCDQIDYINDDYAEDFIPCQLSSKRKEILGEEAIKELNTFLDDWVTKYCPVNFYDIEKVKSYTITAEDIEELLK